MTRKEYSMASSGEAATTLLSTIRWQDEAVTLKEFAAKHPVPNLVKVTKGQYRGAIGVTKSVQSELFLHSISTGKKVLVESVKIKDGKATCSHQKYGIPLTYQGWFEVLSENGQAVQPLFTVQELLASVAASKNKQPTYLVREPLKGLTSTLEETGELSVLKEVPVGEIVTVGGEVVRNQVVSKQTAVSRRFASVTMQSSNETVYIAIESKCKLSPIAGLQNISGVHNIQALLEKFRLPIMVRLVHGLIPTKLEKRFTAIFRLLRIYGDETVFFLPLKKDSKMVPISTREPLRVVACDNFSEVKDSAEVEALQERCEKMHASFMNSIHVLYSAPEPEQQAGDARDKAAIATGPIVEEDILFKEVEDIYQHVRQGGEPPAPRPRPPHIAQGAAAMPKKEGKKTSILGSFAMKFVRNKDGSSATHVKSAGGGEAPLGAPRENEEPPPLPAKKSIKHKDMDYWEEPIYEPLDKIRKMKRGKQAEEIIPMSSSGPRLLDSTDNIEPVTNPLLTTSNKKLASDAANVSNDGEIKTLREVYKHTVDVSQGSNSSTNSKKEAPSSFESSVPIPKPDYEETEVDQEPSPPPVPPKNFETPKVDYPDSSQEATAAKSAYARSKPEKTEATRPKTVHGTKPSNAKPKLAVTSPGFDQPPTMIPRVNSDKALKVTNPHLSASSPDNSRPFLIRNVSSSERKYKGTTVMIEGDASPLSVEQPRSKDNSPGQFTSPIRSGLVASAVHQHSRQIPTGKAGVGHVQPARSGAPHKRTAPQPPAHVASAHITSTTGAAPATSGSGAAHPPFVAVARVGDSFEQENPLFKNGSAVAHRINMFDNRKNMHSVYL